MVDDQEHALRFYRPLRSSPPISALRWTASRRAAWCFAANRRRWAPSSPSFSRTPAATYFPHLGHEMMPGNTLVHALRWAAGIASPAYAIDDQTALKVVDGVIEVVSEGHWKRLDCP